MRRVRVGLAQINPTVGAIEANARLVVDWMGRARAAGCDLVAFPELTLTGYPPEDLLFKPAFIEANLRALADVARQSRGLTAVLGFVDKRDDIFNASPRCSQRVALAGISVLRRLRRRGGWCGQSGRSGGRRRGCGLR